MTQPAASITVTVERAWSHLMATMGRTNLGRARQARKAANQLNAYWRNH